MDGGKRLVRGCRSASMSSKGLLANSTYSPATQAAAHNILCKCTLPSNAGSINRSRPTRTSSILASLTLMPMSTSCVSISSPFWQLGIVAISPRRDTYQSKSTTISYKFLEHVLKMESNISLQNPGSDFNA
ncbi:hypothetical protein V8G54_003976 [Vigna mungo]|uniref:Uncharacterized protein n=1 Tax=Vigna mungo TaxID=3915 RepID=A0AAQ3PEN1_VIGMU